MEETANKTRKQKVFQEESINPLRAEKAIVRFVPHQGGPEGDDPRHVLSGGKAEGAPDRFCVPILRSTGAYKNVLTDSEKEFLEERLGLESNALSVYRKVNNYWDNYFVTVDKNGLTLDLLDPGQYIQYKVLLANTETIAPSLEDLQDRPKTTYRYVLVKEDDESRIENSKMDTTMQCYKEFGKIDSDKDTMRVLVELLDLRPYAVNTKTEFLRSRINQLIQADAKTFLKTITDPMLHTKVILRRAVELGKVSRRGDYYYLRSDNSPMCDGGQDPTLSNAAKWLNLPSHQDIKALLETEVGNARN